ncbi:hypothetical protein RI570_21515 [Brucella pseudogrignonensis]|uniref:hypothetical protein n=1 Tax=Brucella pseudogrignonensis TaxID=419475 RepID=UPI0028BCF757|nr:hypothetical protein [Brucella pseudogrignonensis]MDT6940721.1 hypothetical protein [Brucella pseudogrignonensis]MDT6940756.1 hypothetical protein [Brucella pseudogrignonensis]MDT6942631.1 hypothetical protein [Brucella pseudogrignonensis]
MTIVEAIASVTGALKIVNELRSIDAQFDKAELKAKLADVMSQLADAKIGLIEASEVIEAEKSEAKRLKSAFEFRGKLVEYNGFKYEPFDDGSPKGEPFCPRCEQNFGRFYRLTQYRGGGYSNLTCPECKANFNTTVFVWQK